MRNILSATLIFLVYRIHLKILREGDDNQAGPGFLLLKTGWTPGMGALIRYTELAVLSMQFMQQCVMMMDYNSIYMHRSGKFSRVSNLADRRSLPFSPV